MDKKNVPFCIAPWVHSHYSIEGVRPLCCQAVHHEKIELTREQSFEDYWNSEYMKDIRLKMIDHKPPKECINCINSTSTEVLKDVMQRRFGHHLDELIQSTNSEGNTDFYPVSLDYRPSNVCNLKCRMCNGESSTSIENELKEYRKITYSTSNKKEFVKNVITPEIENFTKSGRIEDYYWAGGEPFLMSNVWETINYLEENSLFDTRLAFNTNLTVLKFGKNDVFNLLQKFKNTFLILSIDGVGETGEYIRDGLKWDEFYQNYNHVSQTISDKNNISFIITLSLPSIANINSLLDFFEDLEYKHNYIVQLSHLLGVESFISPLFLPKDIQESLANELEENLNKRNNPYLDNFRSVISFLRESKCPTKLFSDYNNRKDEYKRYYKHLDRTRGGKDLKYFLKGNKYLSDWLGDYSESLSPLTKLNWQDSLRDSVQDSRWMFKNQSFFMMRFAQS